MKKLKQAQGNWVDGDKFWGREVEIDLLKGKLDDGAHVLLVAQRRMGKTSLMHETARQLTEAGQYTCLFVDLQGKTSAEEAIVELSLSAREHKKLWGKIQGVFANAWGAVKDQIEKINIYDLSIHLRAGITSGDWKAKGDEIFGILAAAEKPVVLFLDEVPILINRILKGDDFTITPERRGKADEFLSWLRANCLKHKGHVRVVISGSIGLEPVLRQANLSATINHCSPFDLQPWDRETAIGCLEALAEEYEIRFEPGVSDAVVTCLDYLVPHHVQMFFTRIQESYVRKKRARIAVNEIETIYKEGMLSIAGHAELTHYEERLQLVLGKDTFKIALDMLTEASVSSVLGTAALEWFRSDAAAQLDAEGSQRDLFEVQKNILWVLEHDGYLKRADGGYVFVSRLLRDWWKTRYGGLFYTPVSKRIDSSRQNP